MNKVEATYHSVQMGQKTKNKGYVSTLTLGGKKYLSYPELRPTMELAEEEAARKAMISIKESKGNYNDCIGNERKVMVMRDNNLVIKIKC